jgi:hypothetical protein
LSVQALARRAPPTASVGNLLPWIAAEQAALISAAKTT